MNRHERRAQGKGASISQVSKLPQHLLLHCPGVKIPGMDFAMACAAGAAVAAPLSALGSSEALHRVLQDVGWVLAIGGDTAAPEIHDGADLTQQRLFLDPLCPACGSKLMQSMGMAEG